MVHILSAIHPEIAPLLPRLSLRADPALPRHWRGEGLTLTLTGTGPLRASAMTARLLTLLPPGEGDFLLSLGTCMAAPHMETGRLYAASTLQDLASGQSMYPDMLLRLNLPEAFLTTGSRVLSGMDFPGDLYDMEASGIFLSASQFLGPHQMVFLRLATDRGEAVTAEAVSSAVERCLPNLLRVLDILRALSREREEDMPDSSLYEELRCSHAMRLRLAQLLRYAALARIPLEPVLDRYRAMHLLPCPGRKEGKEILERLERDLSEPCLQPPVCGGAGSVSSPDPGHPRPLSQSPGDSHPSSQGHLQPAPAGPEKPVPVPGPDPGQA